MTVYFIGAGPGDPDLITVKGRKLIESCPVCLYAGSLVPEQVVAFAPDDATVVDTAQLHLEEIVEAIVQADAECKDVARVHSGDPSLYGAIAEQIRCLVDRRIRYEIVPGVPAFAAAAAAIGQELTIPEIVQTVILTRTSMKSSSMPEDESLDMLGRSGATLAIHLSIRNTREIERRLIPLYGKDCPAIVAYRVTWHDQQILRTTLESLHASVRAAKLTRTALVLVGRGLGVEEHRFSALYDASHPHVLRPIVSSRPTRPRKSDARKSR